MASLTIQISLCRTVWQPQRQQVSGPRTTTAAIFQEQEQKARECLHRYPQGYLCRQGEAPPAGGVLLSFRSPSNEF